MDFGLIAYPVRTRLTNEVITITEIKKIFLKTFKYPKKQLFLSYYIAQSKILD